MRYRIILACLLSVLVLAVAQVPRPTIKTVFLVDDVATLLTLGPSFRLGEGRVLDVVVPQQHAHVTGKRLPWDSVRGGWILPPGTTTNVIVNFHGHTLTSQAMAAPSTVYDYSIEGDLVKPKDGSQPWPAYYHVYFSYEIPAALQP